MKRNVVVLDFDGLFSYPDFKSRIIEPLVEQERDIVVWTFNIEERVRQKLERMGMPDFAASSRIIDAYRYQWFRDGIKEVISGVRSAHDGRFIQNLLQDSNISSNEETVSRIVGHFQDILTLEAGNRIYKYPPFLGDQNYLLVESDRASGFGGPLRRVNTSTEMAISEHGGHSLIMVPEHPNSWNEFVYPPVNVSPEEVMNALTPAILNWSGEPIRRDLAIEFGIFQEVEGYHQEQIGRPIERF